MSPTSSSQTLRADCPRCGASIPDAQATHCSCCGGELAPSASGPAPTPGISFASAFASGASGPRAPGLRLAPGFGPAAPLRRSSAGAPSTHAAPLASLGSRLALVRQQREFERWSEERPLGLAHGLGLGAMGLFGLFLGVMPLLGLVQTRQPRDTGLVMGLFALIGLGLASFAIVQLVLFYRAPILHRPAQVFDERCEVRRTKSGYRTSHYATFAFEGGEREEFRIGSSLAATIGRGDVGLVVSRHRVLLAFHAVRSA